VKCYCSSKTLVLYESFSIYLISDVKPRYLIQTYRQKRFGFYILAWKYLMRSLGVESIRKHWCWSGTVAIDAFIFFEHAVFLLVIYYSLGPRRSRFICNMQ